MMDSHVSSLPIADTGRHIFIIEEHYPGETRSRLNIDMPS